MTTLAIPIGASRIAGVLSGREGLQFAMPGRWNNPNAVWSAGRKRIQAPNAQASDIARAYFPWYGGIKKGVSNKVPIGGYDVASKDGGLLLEAAKTNGLTDFDSGWTIRGVATITGGQADPFGGNDAYVFGSLGAVSVDDAFQLDVFPSIETVDKVSLGVMIHPNGKTGTLRLDNPHNAAQGRWNVGLSALSQKWHWITNDHAAVTVDVEFQATGGGNPAVGLWIYALSGDCDCLVFWPNLIDSGRHVIGSPIAPAATRAVDKLDFSNADDENLTAATGAICLAHTPLSDAPNHHIFDSRDAALNDGVRIYIEGGVLRCQVRSGGANTMTVVSAIVPVRGVRMIIYVTWAAGDLRMYVDGVLVGTPVTSGAAPTAQYEIKFYKSNQASNVPEGCVSLVHIFEPTHSAELSVANSAELAAM